MGLDLLHLLSRRRALYRNAGRGQPGQAGRHHARARRPDRGDDRVGARPPGERPAGVRLAFQVAPGSDLGDLSARLSKTGIKSERRSSITPGIAQAVVFTDPKGTSVEIFSDYAFAKDDDSYTGIMPRKLGHVAFHTPDVAATVKFYCDVLGFK